MTYTSALNSVLLILGPVIVTYFAFELNKREDGQRTTLTALLLSFLANAARLTMLAMTALVLGSGGLDEEASKSLVFHWGQITLNTLLTVVLETYALKYALS